MSNHKQMVEKANDAFAMNDIERFLALCEEDVIWTMVGDQTVKGKDAIREFMKSAPAEPPTFSVEFVVAEGDFAIAHGNMQLKDAEGTVTPYAYCDIYRFRGDKIAELKAFIIKTP